MKFIFNIILCIIISVYAGIYTPEQIQISLTGNGGFAITYTTNSNVVYKTISPPPSTNVYYGTNPNKLTSKFVGVSNLFEDERGYKAYIHKVVLTGLTPNTKYYYRVGDTDKTEGLSLISNFNTAIPKVWAVYGDFGFTNIERSLGPLYDGAKNNEYQGVLHIGDIAYDLHNGKGKRGDDFLNDIQPISSTMPYMYTVGNHEKDGNFTHYLNRFPALANLGINSKSDTPLWYSFNQPYVHYVVIDTEIYSYYPDKGQQKRHLKWLEDDLIQANKNRNLYPWIVMLGHKCDWQDEVDFTDFRDLAHRYGVDVHICGHQHNYQRLFPALKSKVQVYDNDELYINPKYWVQIVVGSPGCQEKISSGVCKRKDVLARYFLSYGYGLLQVHNSTHLTWDWKQTHTATAENAADDLAKKIILGYNQTASSPQFKDHVTIVQHNHGRRT